ncbi:cell division protein ZapA [Arenimonas alkanexedens]
MSEPVNVKILDREYTVGVEPAERESLMAAAQLLDARMRELRGSNRMAAIDRVAVLTALNLAHELQQLKQAAEARDLAISLSLGELNRKLDGLFDTPR